MSSDQPPTDDWDEIHGFVSPGEFRRFQNWIVKQVQEGALVEVQVEEPYSGSPLFDERWFHTTSGTVWRLVAPDPPFRGVFERVS